MYFLIGISLLFAYLYAVNLTASLMSTLLWRAISGRASHWSGETRSNLIFALRILPLIAALIFIAAFIVPSYLMFEPASPSERVGLKLTMIVGIAVFGMAAATVRIFASWWRTRRLITDWMRSSEPVKVGGVSFPAYKLKHQFPVIAVVGVIRPKIFVAEQVLAELDEAELTAAIAHEAGHIYSLDNLKRIAMRICADLLVFPLGKSLDRVWLESAECAADEYAATHGGCGSALNLASALVKIGRITPEKKVWDMPMAAYLIEPDDGSIATRVDSLLHIADQESGGSNNKSVRRSPIFWLIPALAVILPLALNRSVLSSIHTLSEKVLAALQ